MSDSEDEDMHTPVVCCVCKSIVETYYTLQTTKTYIVEDRIMRVESVYCESCCPTVFREAIKEEEDRVRQIKQRYDEQLIVYDNRRRELTEALRTAGLELRTDSQLCANYIYQGEDTIPRIIDRMSQMKYLFEFCDIKTVMSEIIATGTFKPDGKYSLLREAERRILEK